MAKIRRIIPFGLWPANWGLTGKRREIERLSYYYDGEDLDRRLIEIEGLDEKEKEIRYLFLDLKYQRITNEEYDRKLNEIKNDFETIEYDIQNLKLDYKYKHITKSEYEYKYDMLKADFHNPKNGPERDIAQLEVDFKHNKINDVEYRKLKATILKEPWFEILDGSYHPHERDTGLFALDMDWNSQFIEHLIINGWSGDTEDEIIDKWFRNTMMQIMGIDPEEEEAPINSLPKINKSSKNGRSDYS